MIDFLTFSQRGFSCALSNRVGDTVIAGMLGLSGAFVAWQALRLGLGDLASPGPGFFPFFLGAILLLAALIIGLDCWRSPPTQAVEMGHRDVVISTAVLLLVPLLFEPL